MTNEARLSKPKAALCAAFSVVLACGLAIPVSSAFAAPSDEKQAEADAALEKLNAYQAELDQANGNYEAAMQDKIDAEAKVKDAQKQIEEKSSEIEQLQSQLGQRAREMYRSGDTNFIDVILGSSTFEQFATTWNMLETLNSNDAELVSETKSAREQLESAKTEAQEQAQVASDKAEECKSVAEAADQKASEMQSVYDSLSAEAAQLVEEEQAAQEAAEQAAAAEAEENGTAGDAAAAANEGNDDNADDGDDGDDNANDNAAATNNNSNNSSSNTTKTTTKKTTTKKSNSNNSKKQTVSGNSVVDRAYAEIGKPYVWGGVGPSGYDCSGLVSYCILGKHTRLGTTGTFMGYTRVSNPQPGDICVNSHHAGIYIGGGQMIHAPHSGATVTVSSVHSDMIYVRY